MKLYIKANSLAVLKNLSSLISPAHGKTAYLLERDAPMPYRVNLESATQLHRQRERLFYSDRPLAQLIKGIYFGNSACEHLLASIADIVQAQKLCEAAHHNFVFVFPPLSRFKMDEARFILEHLARKPHSEVVVNDIGTLQMALEYPTLKPILGLGFTKIIKNAFIDHIKPTELSSKQFEEQQTLAKHCEFELESVRRFYKEMGVGRIAIENSGIETSFLNTAPRMQCDLYYPYITLAHAKACDIAGLFDDERGYFVFDECPRYCHSVALEFEHSDILGLHQRYNTVVKPATQLEVKQEVYKNDKNRLVWEVFL